LGEESVETGQVEGVGDDNYRELVTPLLLG
jgi:hypothetical protein